MEEIHHHKPKKRRIYNKLPVVIVEDHQEVLKHIYRAIASRHLPFEGIAMVHLDSHPDLQIPNKMPAQDVFNLAELSNYLSIENWIIPAVFSGHINHLVWMKPPWADQLPEGSRQVTIGQHKSHGTIRIDWPDEYYVSDVMFATKEQMINTKQLDLNIVTLNYEVDHKYSKYQTEEDLKLLLDTSVETKHLKENERVCEEVGQSKQDTDCCKLKSSQQIDHTNNECRTTSTVVCSQKDLTYQNVTQNKILEFSTEQNMIPIEIKQSKESDGQTLSEVSSRKEGTPSSNWMVVDAVKEAVRLGSAFILDIDLDFFSTQNPFKLDYTPEQFEVLKTLYHFDPPKDESTEEILRAQEKRAEQLGDLQNAIALSLKEEGCQSENMSQRWQKMKLFIDGLRASGKDMLSAELIHMAGETTCDDDDDLPHHVSSEQEIDELVERVRDVLSGQPKPVMVTIARSSEDDYCPKSQVNRIQKLVLDMLHELYGEVEVKIDYDEPTECSQPNESLAE